MRELVFARPEHIPQKVNDAILMWGGKPVVCSADGTSWNISVKSLADYRNRAGEWKKIPCEEVSLASPRVGFVNSDKWGAVYVARKPERQWYAGLTRRVLDLYSLNFEEELAYPDGFIHSEGMEEMLLNNYPSFDKTLAKIKKSQAMCLSQAFHRNFALYKIMDYERVDDVVKKTPRIKLFYKTNWIGDYDDTKGGFTLKHRYGDHDFGRVSLDKVGVKIIA